YNLVTVLNQELLEENPEIGDILDIINAALTTEKMIELNAMVDIDGREYQDVAAEFYEILK
ncbi:MAG TPA: glycine betaine ABC transporter substrate-binding protein, partial [Atopostipes sp.]|nr:glycine betaine ABC transporter substrate-binding protein [Atopostipes sp.]